MALTQKQIRFLAKHAQDIADDINFKLNRVRENMAEKLFMESVNKFYSSYTPHLYRRKKDLKNAYKITTKKDGTFIFDVDSTYMKKQHRAENEFIFENSFMEGYHGGAKTIDDDKIPEWGKHPNPGIPYYRKPVPSQCDEGQIPYSKWGKKAKKTDPPYEYLANKWNKWIRDEYEDEKRKILIKVIKQYLNEA